MKSLFKKTALWTAAYAVNIGLLVLLSHYCQSAGQFISSYILVTAAVFAQVGWITETSK